MGSRLMEIKGREIKKRGVFQSSRGATAVSSALLTLGLMSTFLFFISITNIYNSETATTDQGVSVLLIERDIIFYLIGSFIFGSLALVGISIKNLIIGSRSASKDLRDGYLIEAVISKSDKDPSVRYIALLEESKRCISCGSKLRYPSAKFCNVCGREQDTGK